MVQIKFAPISTERLIPGTNVNIQVGIIQNDERSWGVKLTQKGKVIAAKKIKKLIDVEITGIIRDTIGKLVALDTFELGGMLSVLLREVYDKIKEKQKPAEVQAPVSEPERPNVPEVVEPQPAAEQSGGLGIPDIKTPAASGSGDSFWSSYSNIETVTVPSVEPSPAPAQRAPASRGLDDAMAILGSNCPHCGKEVDSDTDTCPYCGQRI
jgi:hypothetical protein